MEFYPYSSPIVLTDAIYLAYGGLTGTSTQAQRNASYLGAEQLMTEAIHAFLLPTVVTGSYLPGLSYAIVTRHAHVNSILGVTLYSRRNDSSCTLNEESTCAYVRDDSYGVVDVRYLSNCGCSSVHYPPYRLQIVYNSGLPSGTAFSPVMLQALTTVAEISLNEMIGWGNESVGDIGVQEFENQEYQEKRIPLLRTALGNSAKANFAMRLVRHLRRPRRIGL